MKICSTCESSEKWKLKPFWDITSQLSELLSSKSPQTGFTLWHSRLKIHHCHCSTLGHYWGAGSIPGWGTSTCGCSQEKKIVYIFLRFLYVQVISSETRDSLNFSCPIWRPFAAFSCLIALYSKLNKSGEKRLSCLVLILKKKLSSFSLSSVQWLFS